MHAVCAHHVVIGTKDEPKASAWVPGPFARWWKEGKGLGNVKWALESVAGGEAWAPKLPQAGVNLESSSCLQINRSIQKKSGCGVGTD